MWWIVDKLKMGNTIRRRRECEECHYRFTTYERVEERTLVVVKKDGTREQFSRDKSLMVLSAQLKNGLFLVTKSKKIVNRIEQKVRSQSDNEINSEYIGSLVMDELADLDEITYVRFASVYRSFKDVGELETS